MLWYEFERVLIGIREMLYHADHRDLKLAPRWRR